MESSNANKLMLMGLVGFAAGVLFAPDKGAITRDKLKHRADEITEKAKQKSEQAKDKIREMKAKRNQNTDQPDLTLNETEHLVP
jgi:gas vesicle protein